MALFYCIQNFERLLFECVKCSIKFFQLRDLTKHVETHYTATTYICDIGRCGKKFSTNEFLISHKMNHKARADAKVCIPENGVSAVQSKVVKENNDTAINNSFEQASADTSHSGSSGITQVHTQNIFT